VSSPGVKLTPGEGNEERIKTYSEAFKMQVMKEISSFTIHFSHDCQRSIL
jgi:hypothetical protein